MRITKAQARAIVEELQALEVDDLLKVIVKEDPDLNTPRGVLRVLLKDHWSQQVIVVARDGSIERPGAPMATQLPGQASIPLS
jgi:protein involved in polysaccharide export with SLBB domain